MSSHREKSLVKNTLIISLGTFLPRLTSIITLPILTAFLTNAEYGTLDLINTLVSLLLPVATLQIQLAAFRFLIDHRNKHEKSSKIITNIVVFIAATSLITLTILFFSLHLLSIKIRVLICLYFFIDIFYITLQQIARGLSKNRLYSESAIVQSLINLFMLILTVYYFDSGLLGAILSLFSATLLATIFLITRGQIISFINFKLISKTTIKKMISYSWPMVPNSLSLWVVNLSDRLIITGFLGIEANAIYAVSNKIPSLFSIVQTAFVFAWQESASIASKDEDSAAYYTSMFDNVYCVLIGLMSLLIAVTPILFSLLIQGEYEASYYQMPILFLGMLFSSLSSFMGGIYIAYLKTKSVGVTTIGAALLNLTINILLVNHIGIYAASISTLVSYLGLLIFRMIDLRKILKINYNWTKVSFLLGILIFMSILSYQKINILNLVNAVIAIVLTVSINLKTLIGIKNLLMKKLKR
ncbi:lipopolysaccharide biosynthesis protein [Marinilactibacillus psychrotolerans]|uniref:lipopolysaccharide biosynthesis protein n=1 Tax=Marinilactibacillus psychrotolerans TaxID=191770 RepID=UPI0018678785|nr:oligosaccharide flippase family protein [Marinilactibacillus psychrotolerans]